MGFWPFGRKSRRSSGIEEKTVSSAEEKMPRRTTADARQPHSSGQMASTAGKGLNRNDSKRQKLEAAKDITNLSQSQSRVASAAAPPSRAQTAPHSRPNDSNLIHHEKSGLPSQHGSRSLASRATHDTRGDDPTYYFQNPTSQSSLGPENFTAVQRPPTLKAKRSSKDQDFNRRKSSKRKAEDHAREQVIRAMSSSVLTHPSTRTSDPMRRDTKKIPGGMNRHFERPSSNISLPLAESLHESLSEASDHHTFTVNAFSALTPRPTLRYSDPSRKGPLRSMNQSRASTQKEKRPIIPEEDMSSKRRIEGLADELNASGLRELMERDQRRRERKHQKEQEKLQRKLERRAARQQEEERRKAGQGDQSHGREEKMEENMEPGASSREATRLGIESMESGGPGETSPENPFADHRAPKSPGSWLEDPSREHLPQEPPEDPFRDDTSEAPALQGTKPDVMEEQEDLPLPLPPPIGREPRDSIASIASQASASHGGHVLSSTSQLSGLGREVTPDNPENNEADRRDSDTSGRLSNWTSFFKRGGTRQKRGSADRGMATPSDFSNTSRESFSRQPPPPIPPRSFRRSGSTPVRTMSKFREDLPELPVSPISPKETRLEEAPAPIAAVATSSSPHPDRSSDGLGEKSLRDRSTAPVSEHAKESAHRSIDTNPSSEMEQPRSAVVSQSLASVDSEASWLSGKPVKRASVPSSQPLQESQESSDPKEEGDVAEDPYFARLNPGPDNRRESGSAVQRKASSSAIGAESDIDSDDENAFPLVGDTEEEMIHKSVEQFPTIVHAEPTAKSKEGLLQEYQSSGSEATSPEISGTPEDETPGSGTGPSEERWIHRATSVDYGKGRSGHARVISSGSAKLLDLPRRGSIDSKRLSSASGEKMGTSQGESAVKEEKS